MARIAAMIAATPVAGYVGCAEAIRRLDITDRLPAITKPTLVVVGADDPGTPPAASEVIAAGIPGARLEIIPSASHLCCIEQPELFNRLVRDFLED
jgi:3-oxoadipate enol-lactonase